MTRLPAHRKNAQNTTSAWPSASLDIRGEHWGDVFLKEAEPTMGRPMHRRHLVPLSPPLPLAFILSAVSDYRVTASSQDKERRGFVVKHHIIHRCSDLSAIPHSNLTPKQCPTLPQLVHSPILQPLETRRLLTPVNKAAQALSRSPNKPNILNRLSNRKYGILR